MALQSSGAISLANVQTEFGGSNPIGINEYYGVAAGVPGSGTISLNDFYGKSAVPPITWSNNPRTLGTSQTDSPVNDTASFTGNTVTPGAQSKFNIGIGPRSGGQISLRFYLAGSLLNTWTVTSNYSVQYIPTIGSSSVRFDSTITDGNGYIYGGPVALPYVIIYANFVSNNDVGPDCYYHSHDYTAFGNRD